MRHQRELYRSVPFALLHWSYRWRLLLNEIEHLKPDILCLQEVDQYEQIEEDLHYLG